MNIHSNRLYHLLTIFHTRSNDLSQPSTHIKLEIGSFAQSRSKNSRYPLEGLCHVGGAFTEPGQKIPYLVLQDIVGFSLDLAPFLLKL